MKKYILLLVVALLLAACGSGDEVKIITATPEAVGAVPMGVSAGEAFAPPVEYESTPYTVWMEGEVTIYGLNPVPATPTPSPTLTPTLTNTPTDTPEFTPAPTYTPIPSVTPTPTATAVPPTDFETVWDFDFDYTFNKNALPTTQRFWYDQMIATFTEPRQTPNMEDVSESGDLYDYGRTLNEYITMIMTVFRYNGDPDLFDHAEALMETMWDQLTISTVSEFTREGPAIDGVGEHQYRHWAWLQDPTYSGYGYDYHQMDTLLTHSLVAYWTYVLKELDDPAWEKWYNYLLYDFYGIWDYRENAGTHQLLKTLTHPYTAHLRLLYYMYLLTEDSRWSTQRDTYYSILVTGNSCDTTRSPVFRQQGDGTIIWDHRVPCYGYPDYGWQSTLYAQATMNAVIDLHFQQYGLFGDDAYFFKFVKTFRDRVIGLPSQYALAYKVDGSGMGSGEMGNYTTGNTQAFAMWDLTGEIKTFNQWLYYSHTYNICYSYDTMTGCRNTFAPAWMYLTLSVQSNAVEYGIQDDYGDTIPVPSFDLPTEVEGAQSFALPLSDVPESFIAVWPDGSTTEYTIGTQPTVEPTVAPTEVPDVPTCAMTVATNYLAVRKEPSTIAALVEWMVNGKEITIDEAQYVDGYLWGHHSAGWSAIYAYDDQEYYLVGDLDECQNVSGWPEVWPPPNDSTTQRTPALIWHEVPGANVNNMFASYQILDDAELRFGVKPYADMEICRNTVLAGGICIFRNPPGGQDCPNVDAADPAAEAVRWANLLEANSVVYLRDLIPTGRVKIEVCNECRYDWDTLYWWRDFMIAFIQYTDGRNWPALVMPTLGPGWGDAVMFRVWEPALQMMIDRGYSIGFHTYNPGGDEMLCPYNEWLSFRHRTNHEDLVELGLGDLDVDITEVGQGWGNTTPNIEDYVCWFKAIQIDTYVDTIALWTAGYNGTWPKANLDNYMIPIAQTVVAWLN